MPNANPTPRGTGEGIFSELHRLRSDNERMREQLKEADKLLKRAKGVAAGWYRLHLASVTIGKYEQVEDAGVIDTETSTCRAMVEQADLLSADITKHQKLGELF